MERCGIVIFILCHFLPIVLCDIEQKACDSKERDPARALLQVKGTRERMVLNASSGVSISESARVRFEDATSATPANQAFFKRESEGGAVYTGVGETATMDDQGYYSVAATCCRVEMLTFIRRTITSLDLEVCIEAGLASLVPQFTCDTATTNPTNKTYAILMNTLLSNVPPAKCAAVAPRGTCFSSGSRMPIEPGHEQLLEECKSLGKFDFNGMDYARHCRDATGTSPPAVAKNMLPNELYLLGIATFGSEAKLDEIILQAYQVKVSYAGQELDLRLRQGDNALLRYGSSGEDGSDYGLPIEGAEKTSLLQGSGGVMNIVDIGGNYGVVSIALFKALQGQLRAVSIEAMPSTYFFLRWNMYNNGVPFLDSTSVRSANAVGIAAINAGVTSNEQVFMSMCYSADNSMNSAKNNGGCPPQDVVTVPGVSVDTLFNLFEHKQAISLVKLDCEGCEEQAAPDLAKYASRVRRMVGELHAPSEPVINSVCMFNAEKYFTKICKVSRGNDVQWEAISLACGVDARPLCVW